MEIQVESMFESVPCPFGCLPNDEKVLVGKDSINNIAGEFEIVKCKTCGLMRTDPRPTIDSIGIFYPDDYAPYMTSADDNLAKESKNYLKKILRPLIKNIFKFKVKTLPNIEPGKMLEVGCASGDFLKQMHDLGWDVTGIEFSEKAAASASARGYEIYAGPLEAAPDLPAEFDLIVGWMVLEHLHDPIGCLKRLRQWAKPNAWLVLSVPNADSFDFKIFKEKWYSLHLPNHLYHFSPNTLRKLLQVSGWNVDTVHHQRVLTDLVVSTGNFLVEKGYLRTGSYMRNFANNQSYWVYILYPLAWLMSKFGQTGRMTIWARAG